PFSNRLALIEMSSSLGAGLVQVLKRRSGKLELPGGLQADRAVSPLQCNDVAGLFHRLPAVFGQAVEEIADSAGLVVARRAVVGEAIDELLVLRADTPAGRAFLPGLEDREKVGAALDRTGVAIVGLGCHPEGARSDGAKRAPAPSRL